MSRKKKPKVKRKGGRRMGATGGGIMGAVKMLGAVTAGIVVGRLINSSMATTDGKLLGGGEAIVGAGIYMKAKNPLIKAVGAGLGGNGLLYALGAKGLNVLPASMGYGPPMQYGYRSMNGYRDVPKIGFPKPNNIGRVGNAEMNRTAAMYAGVYN